MVPKQKMTSFELVVKGILGIKLLGIDTTTAKR
jgi:hypothetical protein